MNEEMDRFEPSPMPAALRKLVEHLSALDAQAGATPSMESDMLSLLVSGILNGENLAEHYPAFHRKLFEDSVLRQVFIDALEAIEAERAGELLPMPGASQNKPSFLSNAPAVPTLEVFDGQTWRATWQRTLEQLQAIFSPPEMAYRADPSLAEDAWFTLLREQMTAKDITYDIVLDCTLSNEDEGSLLAFLNLALTLGSPTQFTGFPLRTSLHWGAYHESVLVTDEGRVKFPAIPFAAIFDQAGLQLQAGFRLTLETVS